MIPPKERLRKFWSSGGPQPGERKKDDKPEQGEVHSHVLMDGQGSRTVDGVKAESARTQNDGSGEDPQTDKP